MNKIVLTGSLLLFSLFCLTSMAFSAPMEIFVSIPPQKWICDKLGGTLVTTHVLVGKGQDPHTYEPTPRQLTSLSRAKLYFTLDLEFEGQIIPKLKKTVPTLHFVDTADSIAKIAMTGEGHDNDEQSISGQTTKEHHHQEGLDPHVWLSPPNLKIMATSMARAMMTEDPANKSSYEKNLEEVLRTLDRLHQGITQQLAPLQGASFYVFHPAFGYFAHTYHLRQEAIETGGKSPTPRQLSALITQARANKAQVIFVQPQFDPRSAAAIANAIGGEVVPLDPLAEDVAANLEIMAQRIKAAFTAR
ncbi:MAG: zinc ABC transporter substrate-binding protein [Proteobacteria bacterium]|nr:zinc ABC transporter substrate-binding protein [Pseudomonadota bacterium]MBU1648548.1 zinc ABC transporter substrate-binding protein [Pseudomonadota bacterium]MBU1985587.1 zinc ABC transporter substrate-binding protein [Pseudomonadota bacterium]